MVLGWNGVEGRKKRKEKMKEAERKVVLLTFPSDPATEHQFCDIEGSTPYPGVRNLSNDRSNRKMQNKVMKCHFLPRELAKLDSDNTQCWMDEH